MIFSGSQQNQSAPGFAGLSEEMLTSWRKNLEQSVFGSAAASGRFPWDSSSRAPASPTTNRSDTPINDRHTPVDGSKTPSDEGRFSPGMRSVESKSPDKVEGVSPTPSPQGLVPRSFANTVNTSSSPNQSQLSIPPLFTSRIPKGDPLEERLHDMLR